EEHEDRPAALMLYTPGHRLRLLECGNCAGGHRRGGVWRRLHSRLMLGNLGYGNGLRGAFDLAERRAAGKADRRVFIAESAAAQTGLRGHGPNLHGLRLEGASAASVPTAMSSGSRPADHVPRQKR